MNPQPAWSASCEKPSPLAVLLALAPTVYAADTQDIEKGKEQVKEAGVFIGQQIEVIDKNSRYGDMPADNAAAGLAAAKASITNTSGKSRQAKPSLAIKLPGAVTATFYNDEPAIPGLRGKKFQQYQLMADTVVANRIETRRRVRHLRCLAGSFCACPH